MRPALAGVLLLLCWTGSPRQLDAQRLGDTPTITVSVDGTVAFLATAALLDGRPLHPRSLREGRGTITFDVFPGSWSGDEICGEETGGTCTVHVRFPDPDGDFGALCMEVTEAVLTDVNEDGSPASFFGRMSGDEDDCDGVP
ncbi:MAG: hypothetical protein AAF389_11575 [Gemmatimonadota bacterium]